MNKLVVFIDFDNTIADTRGNMLKILNNKYGKNYKLKDVHDTMFKGMFNFKEADEPKKIYNTEEFFDSLDFMNGAYKVLEELQDKVVVEFVSVCSESGEEFKRDWLAKHLPENLEWDFFAVYKDDGEDKSIVPMRGCIQIDDRMDDLMETDSSCKVCFKNYIERPWNRRIVNEPIYEVNNWNEIGDIIKYAIDHREFAVENEVDSLFDNENVIKINPRLLGDWL